MRPIIVRAAKRSSVPGQSAAPRPVRHVGADEAWRHGVHSDVALAQLEGKAPRENHDLGLRCRVECIARSAVPIAAIEAD